MITEFCTFNRCSKVLRLGSILFLSSSNSVDSCIGKRILSVTVYWKHMGSNHINRVIEADETESTGNHIIITLIGFAPSPLSEGPVTGSCL